MRSLLPIIAISFVLFGCATTPQIPVSAGESAIDVGNKRVQFKYEPIGPIGTVERDITVTGFRIRNPAGAAVVVTPRQAPGQTGNHPDLWVVKVTNVTSTSVSVKIRRIDAGVPGALPIGISVMVMD